MPRELRLNPSRCKSDFLSVVDLEVRNAGGQTSLRPLFSRPVRRGRQAGLKIQQLPHRALEVFGPHVASHEVSGRIEQQHRRKLINRMLFGDGVFPIAAIVIVRPGELFATREFEQCFPRRLGCRDELFGRVRRFSAVQAGDRAAFERNPDNFKTLAVIGRVNFFDRRKTLSTGSTRWLLLPQLPPSSEQRVDPVSPLSPRERHLLNPSPLSPRALPGERAPPAVRGVRRRYGFRWSPPASLAVREQR